MFYWVSGGIEPSKGKWDVPGGFLDYHEHPEIGLKREMKEETNLEVEIDHLLGFFMDDSYGKEKMSTLNICFIVRVIGGVPKAGDDIRELSCFIPQGLPSEFAFKNARDTFNLCLRDKKKS